MKRMAIVAPVAAAMLLSAAAFAGAAPVTEASSDVTVKAAVNPKITLTVSAPDTASSVDFGTVDPGASYGGKTVGLSVSSNKSFDLVAAQDTSAFGDIVLNRSLAVVSDVAKGGDIPFSDSYGIDVPWTVDPGAHTASVTYTVTQD